MQPEARRSTACRARIDAAIDALARLYECGHLLADIEPDRLLGLATEEIVERRRTPEVHRYEYCSRCRGSPAGVGFLPCRAYRERPPEHERLMSPYCTAACPECHGEGSTPCLDCDAASAPECGPGVVKR